MPDDPTTLRECLLDAKEASKTAAAWAEATDLFPHHATVAARFAAQAAKAASPATEAARIAARIATNAKGHTRAEAERANTEAQRIREYADVAALAATHAQASARAARPFVPPTGPRADLERARQQAYFAWLACPAAADGNVKLAVLRAQYEEAEAAVQAALAVSALA
jgi:hypothetical protein